MPELAELRLTSDYINKMSCEMDFVSVKKNPVHKGKEISIPYRKFRISARSRGKELMLIIHDKYSDSQMKLLMTMGMSGHFAYTNTTSEPKHSHLMFFTNDGTTLSFVDVRRFGKWRWVDDWSPNRGPDPTTEFEEFKKNIKDNLNKSAFSHPIHLALMNQKYFNGIGNYLRAEILYRLPHIDPWSPACDVINEEKLFILCKEIPSVAYLLGGGQLKDWVNPEGVNASDFKRFMKCYGNPIMSRVRDKNGRTFWYDPKWDNLVNKVNV